MSNTKGLEKVFSAQGTSPQMKHFPSSEDTQISRLQRNAIVEQQIIPEVAIE
jgi:hypothetical protein